jgi:hypothetical protein
MTAPDRLREMVAEATPGPWEWLTDGSENEATPPAPGYVGDLVHDRTLVLWAHGVHTEGYVCIDNSSDARLIALAPEMAALLADMGEGVQAHLDVCSRAAGVHAPLRELLARLDAFIPAEVRA